MDSLQKELQKLKAKVAELESRILFPNEPVAKWQPEGGDWYVSGNGKVFCYTSRNQGYKEYGTERQTEEQAQRAAVEMRRFHRLLALRDELCGDELVDWSNAAELKCSVYFYHPEKMWRVTGSEHGEFITPYFTNRESAQLACDMLNSMEVVL